MRCLAPLVALKGGERLGDKYPVADVPVRLRCLAHEVAPVLGAIRLAEGIHRVDSVGDEAPPWQEVVVSASAHAEQLVGACRVVEQIGDVPNELIADSDSSPICKSIDE